MTTIDLSSGLTISPQERAGLHKALTDLAAATDAAEKRLAVLTALHVLHAGLPALGLVGPAGVLIAAVLDLIVPQVEE